MQKAPSNGGYFKNFKILEMILFASMALALGIVAVESIKDNQEKDRDATRISDVSDIRAALNEYYAANNTFPSCLYKYGDCRSLEESGFMDSVPRDPSTSADYTYAAIGSGSMCKTYHLGTSLERSESQALLTGSDAPPEITADLCTGSQPDFSGLSYAKGGEQCNVLAGTAQPTNAKDGETCYDVKPRPR
jgi:hypothetical protein